MARRYSSRAGQFASVRAANKAAIQKETQRKLSSQRVIDPTTGEEIGYVQSGESFEQAKQRITQEKFKKEFEAAKQERLKQEQLKQRQTQIAAVKQEQRLLPARISNVQETRNITQEQARADLLRRIPNQNRRFEKKSITERIKTSFTETVKKRKGEKESFSKRIKTGPEKPTPKITIQTEGRYNYTIDSNTGETIRTWIPGENKTITLEKIKTKSPRANEKTFVGDFLQQFKQSSGKYIPLSEGQEQARADLLGRVPKTSPKRKEGAVLGEVLLTAREAGVTEQQARETLGIKAGEKVSKEELRERILKVPFAASPDQLKSASRIDVLNLKLGNLFPTEEGIQERMLSRLSPEGKADIKGRMEKLEKKQQEEYGKEGVFTLKGITKEGSVVNPLFFRGTGRGIYKYATEKPASVGATFGVGALFGAGTKGVGLGAEKIVGIGNLRKFEQVISSPASTSTVIAGLNLATMGKKAGTVPTLFESTVEEKGEAAGKFATDVFAFSKGFSTGQKTAVGTYDYLRTIGRTELPTTSIVAPEYYKGQKYPKISKGQTAGELKGEFYKAVLPDEQVGKARGFTASPSTFEAQTLTGRGSSEFPGLYSAPRASPTFLKIGGEKKLVGTEGLLSTGSPTLIRTEFKGGFELAPGVKAGQSSLTPASNLKGFFEGIGGTGKTYVPFIKTEKEAVTAYNSLLTQTGRKYFFRFGGRRVPINQYVVGEGVAGVSKGIPAIKVLNPSYSYSSSTTALINPANVIYSLSYVTPSTKGIVYSISPGTSLPRSSTPSSDIPTIISSPRPASYGSPSKSISSSTSISLPISYPPSPPVSPPRTPPGSPTYRPLYRPITPTRTPPTSSTKLPPFFFGKTKEIKGSGRFPVFLRRFGKFKPIGVGRTKAEAISIGRFAATRTLGATFKVKGIDEPQKLTGFKTKKTKEGIEFIELPKFRLSKAGEKREIQAFRQLKRRKR